jgi:citrate synthase
MSKGLEGVVAAETAISHVYGDEGRLVYSGYEIEDLAANATFEETCHLLWYGALPTRPQLNTLKRRFAESAGIDDRIVTVLRQAQRGTHPMAALRTAVSALSFTDPDTEDMSLEAADRKAVRLTAQSATITAAIDRLRNGAGVNAPRADLGFAANLLFMLRGEEPDELETRIIDAALTLHAEHGMNASTFAARVTAGTKADMHSAVVSAIGALKGPLHGGANERVMEMLLQLDGPADAERYVRETVAARGRVMGFGHRVYRTTDPRAPILKDLAAQLNARSGGASKWLEMSDRIQQTMREEMDRKGRQVHPNVDFFSASVYYTLGIPTDLFTNLFAIARMSGWTAHVIEQMKDNRLIRPQSEYTGPAPRRVVPIDQR